MTLGGFVHLGLERVSAALRNEQLMGTLESLLTTPTSSQTIQIGSILFDLIFIPLRMGLLLLLLALVFGLNLDAGGVPQSLVLLVVLHAVCLGSRHPRGSDRADVPARRRNRRSLDRGADPRLRTVLPPHPAAQLARDRLGRQPARDRGAGLRDALLGGTGWSTIGTTS